MDIENGTEVFRVPQQKDMEPMDVMNDFFAVSVESVLTSLQLFILKTRLLPKTMIH